VNSEGTGILSGLPKKKGFIGKGCLMRRGVIWVSILCVLASGGAAWANLLKNPGFEEGETGQIGRVPIPGWLTWNTNGWHHNDAGAVIDTKAVKLWWSDSGIYQDFPAEAGHTYRLSGYMLHTSADPLRNPDSNPQTEGDKTGDFRVEWYNALGAMLREDAFGQITKNDPTDTWLLYTADITAPPGTAYGRYLIRMYGSRGDGAVNYDNACVYDIALYGQAYGPNPPDGATVELTLASLSWQSHDPEDVFTFDVYLEAEGPVVDPNFYSAPIAVGLTENSVNLADAGVTLMDNTLYTWRVDTTDPNNGFPIVFQGPVWTFQIGDVPPAVDAGANQYVWLVNGEGHFTLSGSYTDDGKSPIIRAEYVEGTHEKAGATVVTMGPQTWDPAARTVTVNVSVTNSVPGQAATGWYGFILEVEDGAGVGTDGVHAGVYGTCLEAAMEDPADNTIETNWPNGHGDINGDCKTDLEDLALLALSWVDCMTVKAGCTP